MLPLWTGPLLVVTIRRQLWGSEPGGHLRSSAPVDVPQIDRTLGTVDLLESQHWPIHAVLGDVKYFVGFQNNDSDARG
jgi:hypothetical protein